ncbi:MAG: ABC transporter ATP-binding protein [Flavobacterium sp.]
MQETVINIQSLSKKYAGADFYSVDDISMDVKRGEILGLLGPNGAGKTTLISMLCGLLKPTSGDFSIEGLNYHNNSKAIRQTIGVVPQEYALYPTLTAAENLMYFGSMYGLKGKNLRREVAEALEHLGLEKFANRQIETYSGGMKRRVNLIAGLLHNPTVLFLDEPTVGVDVHSRSVIIEYLKQVNADGTTIIYTSHHMAEAEDFCTKIAIIDSGKILAEGSASELISSAESAENLEDVFLSLTGKALRDHV